MTTTLTPVKEVEAATVDEWLRRGEAVLIDVREADERARERIKASRHVPLSRFDPSSVPPGRAVLHCKGGRRSLEAANLLVRSGRTEVLSLRGGLDAWKGAGLAVETNRDAPIPIMRQVQIVVGSGVLAGSVLAYFVSPWFFLLTGFFGAGLLFAGLTGACGLAAVLAWMPWNRAPRGG